MSCLNTCNLSHVFFFTGKLYEWFNSCVFNSQIQTACLKFVRNVILDKKMWLDAGHKPIAFNRSCIVYPSLIFMYV